MGTVIGIKFGTTFLFWMSRQKGKHDGLYKSQQLIKEKYQFLNKARKITSFSSTATYYLGPYSMLGRQL